MKRKFVSVILVICIITALVPCVYADLTYDSGSCGEHLEYTYDNGTLTITGTGDMKDYQPVYVPWVRYADLINEIVLPNGLTHIGSGAFAGCKNIQSIHIPDSVTSIGGDAFQKCLSLKNITIPSGVTKISWTMFADCKSLESVVLPPKTEEIENGAFQYCYSLKKIAIPKSVKVIGAQIANGCSMLTEIDYGGSENDWKNIDIWEEYGGTPVNTELLNAKKNINSYISIVINGKYLAFEHMPVNKDGHILVPLRAIFEALGATVNWDSSTQTVTSKLSDTTVELSIGSNSLYVNGRQILLDVPAQLIDGYTMVPVRAVAEAFGAEVSWDNDSKTVLIYTAGNTYSL